MTTRIFDLKGSELTPQQAWAIIRGTRNKDVTLEDIAERFTYEDVISWWRCGKGIARKLGDIMQRRGLELKHKNEMEQEEPEKEVVKEEDTAVRVIRKRLAYIEQEMERLSIEWKTLDELLSTIENESC